MKTITLSDGRALSYELTRKRVRNINCRPKEDGIVYVSASPRVSVREIESVLEKNADFFFSAFKKAKEQRERNKVSTSSVKWLGEEFPVRFIESGREVAVLDKSECRVFTRLPDSAEYVLALIQKAVLTSFEQVCREINAEVLAELAHPDLQPPPTLITIKDMKSRWGSCSYTRGHISINSRLSAYPRETIKAVFWHEYAHYKYHDHSRNFYEFLNTYYPEYFKWHELLKE